MSCFKNHNCVGCRYYYNETIEPKSCHALDNVSFKFDIGDIVKWSGDDYIVEDIIIEGGGIFSYECSPLNDPKIKVIFDEDMLE